MGKLLTLDETRQNLIAWRENCNENALVSLINGNEGLIKHIAKKYQGYGLSLDDLISAGKEGLFKAINNSNYLEFSIETFSTYISSYIEGYMKNELSKHSKHKHVLSFEQFIEVDKNGKEIKIEDLVSTDLIGITEDTIFQFDTDIVKNILQCLNPREREIISLRFGIDRESGRTLKEIAEIFECTHQNIARYEQKALTKLRHPKNIRKLKDLIEK